MEKILLGKLRRQKGQSTTEFALVLPIFLTVLMGLVLFSVLFYAFVTTQSAARAGASALVHDPKNQTVSSIQDIVRSQMIALIPGQINTIIVEPNDTTKWISGAQVSVSVVYIVPFPTFKIPFGAGGGTTLFGPVTVKAVSVMTIE